MTEYKEYTIVVASAPQQLIQLVNEKIKEGWQPFGGVTIASVQPLKDATTTVSIQAMVK